MEDFKLDMFEEDCSSPEFDPEASNEEFDRLTEVGLDFPFHIIG